MYNPCWVCFNNYGHGYSENCKCQYAELLRLLNSYGGIDTIVKVMEWLMFEIKNDNGLPKI